jgi:hypothetical protein
LAFANFPNQGVKDLRGQKQKGRAEARPFREMMDDALVAAPAAYAADQYR